MSYRINNLAPKPFYLDLEVDRVTHTDGEVKPCITQLAVLDPSRPKSERIFSCYIKPPEALRKPNWEELFGSIPQDQMEPFDTAWPKLVTWINQSLDGSRRAVIVMHNGFKHDWEILKTEVNRHLPSTNLAIPTSWKPFCTAYLKNAIDYKTYKEYNSLSALCKMLGGKERKAHDAVNDVKMTKSVFKRLVGKAPMDAVLLAALAPEKPVIKAAQVIRQYVVHHAKSLVHPFSTSHPVVYDFEATGLFPKKGELGDPPRAVQIAIYNPQNNQIFNELINPEMSIPRESSAIHGIYDGDVATAKVFKQVWQSGQTFSSPSSSSSSTQPVQTVFFGYNNWGYDDPLYRSECERAGMKKEYIKTFDVYALAKNLFKGNSKAFKKGFLKLEYLAPLLGIVIQKAHDASSDVLTTWAVFLRFVEGVDWNKILKAMMLKNPVLAIGQLCRDEGTFNVQTILKRHETACSLTIPLAKKYFNQIEKDEFFDPRNLAAFFDIPVANNDDDSYILWRIFLKLTEAVDRKAVIDSINTENPLETLHQIETSGVQTTMNRYLEENMVACKNTESLAKALFGKEVDLKQLARNCEISVFGRTLDLFDTKRLFLALTKGLSRKIVNETLQDPNGVEKLVQLIHEKGTFYPEKIAPSIVVKRERPEDGERIEMDESSLKASRSY